MYWQKLSTLFSSGGNARRSTLAGLAKKDASARLKAILDTDVNPEARPKFRPGLALYPIWTMRSDAAWWPMCCLSVKKGRFPLRLSSKGRIGPNTSARLAFHCRLQGSCTDRASMSRDRVTSLLHLSTALVNNGSAPTSAVSTTVRLTYCFEVRKVCM